MGIRTNPTISTAYPAEGILTNLKNRKAADWLTATTTESATALDVLIKTAYAPRVMNSLGLLISSDEDTLADILWLKYCTVWDRLWTSYTAEYNPIWNVDGTEKETHDLHLKRTGDGSFTDEGNDITKHSGEDVDAHTGDDKTANAGTDTTKNAGDDKTTRSGTNTTTEEEAVQGYNSTTYSPNQKTTTTENPGDTETLTHGLTTSTEHGLTTTLTHGEKETFTHGHTETLTHGKKTTENRNFDDADTGTIEHERHGNIGVTMTQQMLQADLDYWKQLEARFYDNLVRDIVDEITYKIYSDSDESATASAAAASGITSVVVTQLLTEGIPVAEIEVTKNE